MPHPKTDLDKALLLIRQLIQHLRVPPKKTNTDGTDFEIFHHKSLGGLRLFSNALQLYRDSLDKLVTLHQKNYTAQHLSRSAAEDLLQTTILRALRPARNPPNEARSTFERRLSSEIGKLRRQLLTESKRWEVSVQVRGINPTSLPFEYGSVKFLSGNTENAVVLANCLPNYEPKKRRVAANKVRAEQEDRELTRTEISKIFSVEVIASVAVCAFDVQAAKQLGIEKIRRAVDILNFFGGLTDFDRRRGIQRAFIGPEGQCIALHSIVCQADGVLVHKGNRFAGNRPLQMIDLNSDSAKKIGLVRSGEMFACENSTDLESRIINALSWAGRATVAYRREEAFLLFAIALEALLTKPKARGGVTDRLRLRAAHLIGLQLEDRKKIFEIVGRLYEIRSALVHAGDSTQLTDSDLEMVHQVVKAALICVLTDKRFTNMQTASEFERWLDDQVFA